MHHLPIFDPNSPEKTQIKMEFFGVLSYDFFQLFEQIIEDQLCGLFLHLGEFADRSGVCFDGREG